MVGFTLVGIDEWQGGLAAFDAATGIVADHRGRGLAKAMFEHALPGLEERGVGTFVLEVLKNNEPAIRAYRKAGFVISRELNGFRQEVSDILARSDGTETMPIRSIDREVASALAEHADWTPSWENSFNGIARIPDNLIALGAFDGRRCIGGAVYSPILDWVLTLVVAPSHRRRGVGTALVRRLAEALPENVDALRLINVDGSDGGMLRFLADLGFDSLVDQYEMVRPVESPVSKGQKR
jgi:ribosomal protein S18 acetylase RimI-like enzyme